MWPNPQFPADLVTFTEEILNGKLHFLCSDVNPISTKGNAQGETTSNFLPLTSSYSYLCQYETRIKFSTKPCAKEAADHRCFIELLLQKFRKIHRKTPAVEYVFQPFTVLNLGMHVCLSQYYSEYFLFVKTRGGFCIL